jgi:hypothetical protein
MCKKNKCSDEYIYDNILIHIYSREQFLNYINIYLAKAINEFLIESDK